MCARGRPGPLSFPASRAFEHEEGHFHISGRWRMCWRAEIPTTPICPLSPGSGPHFRAWMSRVYLATKSSVLACSKWHLCWALPSSETVGWRRDVNAYHFAVRSHHHSLSSTPSIVRRSVLSTGRRGGRRRTAWKGASESLPPAGRPNSYQRERQEKEVLVRAANA